MAQNTSDPAGIERDLEQTRSRLGGHLSELQGRFSPGQVLDDLMGYFRGSDGAEIGRSLLDNVRGNPMPAAITAVGLAWLMASKQGGAAGRAVAEPDWERSNQPGPHLYGREDYGTTMLRVRDAEQAAPRQPNEAEPAYAARLAELRGQAIGLARHGQESTESFGERIRDALVAAERAVTGTAQGAGTKAMGAVRGAGSRIGSMAASAQGAATDAVHSAGGALSQGGKAAGQVGGNMMAALTDNPVILGALGLAAGALLGALLPQSEQEEAALGGIAGQARDTVTTLAKQGLEGGKHVAQAVMDQGQESAGAHGLAGGKSAGELLDAALSGELAGNAKTVAQDVLRTGDEAVRKEFAASANGAAGPPAPAPSTT